MIQPAGHCSQIARTVTLPLASPVQADEVDIKQNDDDDDDDEPDTRWCVVADS